MSQLRVYHVLKPGMLRSSLPKVPFLSPACLQTQSPYIKGNFVLPSEWLKLPKYIQADDTTILHTRWMIE
jgi:hypothetical protein